MSLPSPSFQDLAEWWEKAVLVQNLQSRELREPDATKKGITAFAVGTSIAAVIQLAIIIVSSSPAPFALLLTAIMFVADTLLFTSCLFIVLRLLRAEIAGQSVFIACLYCFAALVPLLTLLRAEQISGAIELFKQYRDPGLSYLLAATLRRMFPTEPTTLFPVVRMWIIFFLEVSLICYYLLCHLRRLLVGLSFASHAGVRVTVGITLSIVLRTALVQYYFGRMYWLLMGAAVR